VTEDPANLERILERDAREIYAAACRAVMPDRLVESVDMERIAREPLDRGGRLFVALVGKAALGFAVEVDRLIGRDLQSGLAIVPHGYSAAFPNAGREGRLGVIEAGHPEPDAASERAGEALLALAAGCEAGDHLLMILSGGGSALTSAFAGGITLQDGRALTQLLLRSGAEIGEINTVRKHVTRTGGGQVARAAFPAAVTTLAVSDVIGDDPEVIASGLTHPDPSTFDDAMAVLRRYRLEDQVPDSVRYHLEMGALGRVAETPKPGDPVFERCSFRLLGSNATALEAAERAARKRGYLPSPAGTPLRGEARDVGASLAAEIRSLRADRAVALLAGGETTVTVKGSGRGGRNQEVALGAAIALDGHPHECVVLSAGTDGIDGPTPAAGAWASTRTLERARLLGLDAQAFLGRNDAYGFFEAVEGLVVTGPTHTNVMDVVIALTAPGDRAS
jgi:glycerate 2-kinase